MNKNKTSLIIIISAIILIAVLVSLYFFKKDKKLELESNYVSGDQQATPQSNIELARLKAEAETQKLNDLIAQSESLKFSNSNATTSNNFLSNANSYINDPTNGLVDAPLMTLTTSTGIAQTIDLLILERLRAPRTFKTNVLRRRIVNLDF